MPSSRAAASPSEKAALACFADVAHSRTGLPGTSPAGSGRPSSCGGVGRSRATSPLRSSRIGPIDSPLREIASSGWARSWRNSGIGPVRRISITRFVIARISSTLRRSRPSEVPRSAAMVDSRLLRASSAVSGSPSGQSTCRRRKMKLRPSSVTIQLSPSAGTTSPSALRATMPELVASRTSCAPGDRRKPSSKIESGWPTMTMGSPLSSSFPLHAARAGASASTARQARTRLNRAGRAITCTALAGPHALVSAVSVRFCGVGCWADASHWPVRSRTDAHSAASCRQPPAVRAPSSNRFRDRTRPRTDSRASMRPNP